MGAWHAQVHQGAARRPGAREGRSCTALKGLELGQIFFAAHPPAASLSPLCPWRPRLAPLPKQTPLAPRCAPYSTSPLVTSRVPTSRTISSSRCSTTLSPLASYSAASASAGAGFCGFVLGGGGGRSQGAALNCMRAHRVWLPCLHPRTKTSAALAIPPKRVPRHGGPRQAAVLHGRPAGGPAPARASRAPMPCKNMLSERGMPPPGSRVSVSVGRLLVSS
jgi:hypothetical protein